MTLEDLKKEDRISFENLIGQQYNKDKFIDEDVLSFIARVSAKYKIEIAVLINRKGKIVDAFLGDSTRVSISAEQSKYLNGMRLIHTHPFASSKLSDMDLSALKNSKFDCVCALSVDERGLLDGECGFINGDSVDRIYIPNANYVNKYGLFEKLYEYDKMYRDSVDGLHDTSEGEYNAVLVKVALHHENIQDDLEELESLASTAHINTVGKVSQNRVKPDAKYFIGEGKLVELKDTIQLTNANLVIFDNELNPRKQRNLTNALGVRVIDRSLLIIDIFSQRARTSEGKLQIELAQLKYDLPRVSNGRASISGGFRGNSESKSEIDRRVIEKNIQKKTEELKKLKKQRELNRSSRKKNNIPSVAIVGYTNSGKSTLMNLLTRANVYEKDELFATLDTTSRMAYLSDKKEVILVDTVGFIKNLPHEFIEAFSSTLEESIYCDLLLHVIDYSNPTYKEQEKVVEEVLRKLGADSPIIKVYNKLDKVKVEDYPEGENVVCISARKGTNIEKLKSLIVKELEKLNKK